MISLTSLRKNLFPLFSIMSKTTMVVEVVYENVVYELYVVPTDKTPKLSRKRTKTDSQLMPAENCDDCDSIRFTGICMNLNCPSNA